ncbi:MAG TPA: DUF2950 domain-containing protein [Lentisphaeria bacterium]|nr:MAG: hypothetical protein A2X48_04050 [Lentisphaerae bacterium GWF2_49_21]HBC85978.1 DUF2950 domain-containing protein [Lentisphaeria bacterium]
MNKIRYSIIAMVFSLFFAGCTSVKPEMGQVVFNSPDEAVASLKDAVKNNDTKRLMEILGPQGKDIVFSGDDKYDAEARAWFTRKAEEKTGIVKIEEASFIELGNDKWPFPVPIAKYDGKLFFYTAAGVDEMLNRRIGKNELNAIMVCRALVNAQEDYAKIKLLGGAVKEYASKLFSEKGRKDGLYWDDEGSKEKSPIGALIVLASQESPESARKPYHGYFYKILTAQGEAAPGGEKSYMSADGKMTGGFAIAAYPASYGVSGIKTFIVSKNGIIFEKDLGKDTLKSAREMTLFNPDDSWAPVRD